MRGRDGFQKKTSSLGLVALTTDLVVDRTTDPEEGAVKNLGADRIYYCDVQFDGGMRNTILSCCEKGA